VLCSESFAEKGALDEVRNHRGHTQLDVPPLTEVVRVMNHVLHPECELHGKRPKFHHLAHAYPNGDSPYVTSF
jgi:hypothetical protein